MYWVTHLVLGSWINSAKGNWMKMNFLTRTLA